MQIRSEVHWAPQAAEDLLEIWAYFAQMASLELADGLLRDLKRAGERLGENPLLWQARDEIRPGIRAAMITQYAIFYRVKGEGVEIIRVLHSRRDANSILKRKSAGDNV